MNLENNPDEGWCDYCSEPLSKNQPKVFYLCLDSSDSYSTKTNCLYCASCGPKKLVLPDNSHAEFLLYFPEEADHSDLAHSIYPLSPKKLENNGLFLDYSLYGNGYYWNFNQLLKKIFPNQNKSMSPYNQEWISRLKSPQAIISLLNKWGYYDIQDLEKENRRVYLDEEEEEFIKYLGRLHLKTPNPKKFEREVNIKEDFRENYFLEDSV